MAWGGVLKLLHPEQRCDFLSYGDETACKLPLRTMMSGILGSIQFVFIYTPTVETVASQFTETQGPTAPPPPQARPPHHRRLRRGGSAPTWERLASDEGRYLV